MVANQTEKALQIIRTVAPGKEPGSACMIFAAAVAGMRGLTMKHIKVGALFWPDYYVGTGVMSLAICGGWGIASHSPADGKVYLHDEELDDDGGFRGHTWLEDDRGIIDLMHEVDGSDATIYDDKLNVATRWYRRPKLERLVKGYWRKEMQAALKAGRKLAMEVA